MDVKTLAAIVGTLSLGSLVTGCATARTSSSESATTGSQAACKETKKKDTPEMGGEAASQEVKPSATEAQEAGSQR